MTYKELVSRMADRMSMTQEDSDKFIKGFVAEVEQEVRNGGSIQIREFVTFERAEVKEQTKKAPKQTEAKVIPAHFKMKVVVSKKLKHL